MRIVSWNIQHGGTGRAALIVAALERHDPDVIVLLESRRTSASCICRQLAARGWTHRASTAPPGAVNGLCVLSRHRMRVLPRSHPARVFTRGWLEVRFPGNDMTMGAVYAPCERYLLREYWNAILARVTRRAKEPYLLIGDYNAGASHVDAPDYRFMAGEEFGGLDQAGAGDVWRRLNPERTEYTWYSKRPGGAVGRGFRIDHAFASGPLVGRIVGCPYSHDERDARTSDHSMLLVDVGTGPRVGGGWRRGRRLARLADTGAVSSR